MGQWVSWMWVSELWHVGRWWWVVDLWVAMICWCDCRRCGWWVTAWVWLVGHGMSCDGWDDGSRHELRWLMMLMGHGMGWGGWVASLMFCGMKRNREKEIEMIINKK